MTAGRSAQLVGSDLYGHSGKESDIEVISLLLHALAVAGLHEPLLALGHSRICRILLEAAALEPEHTDRLFVALQDKASTDIERLLAATSLSPELRQCLNRLPTLHGGLEVLDEAARLFDDIDHELSVALDELRAITTALASAFPAQQLHIDLCELRGYDYHTGVIFSAYVAGHGESIANGGRYNAIGAVFGRARAATGFDTDLKTLLNLSRREFSEPVKVFAPAGGDAALRREIDTLRAHGRCVVQGFSIDADEARALGCGERLVQDGNEWRLEALA